MIVILEGCDKTGKSTLAKEFTAEGYNYKHFSAPKPGGPTALDEMSTFLISDELVEGITQGKRWVLDRFHLGEMVYPPLFGREPSVDIVSFRGIERQLNFLGGFLIHCTDEVPRIAARYKALGDEPKSKYHQIGDTVRDFNEVVRITELPGATYRIGDNMKMLTKAVIQFHTGFEPIARQRAAMDLAGGRNED